MTDRDKTVLAFLECSKGAIFKAEEIAAAYGWSIRTVYRSLARLKKTRNLVASSGIGYIYRGEKCQS